MKFGLGSVALALALGATVRADCPDYTTFSTTPQGNFSTGPLKLPYMRPAPACRTFNSTSVEKVILDMKARMKDPDLARLFENTFPNTLDTTVKYFNTDNNLAFIITGDITAQWLRDTGNQFAHYHSLLGVDKQLATLVKAVINNEARYVSEYPYCGSFQPPPESGLSPSVNSYATGVTVNPPVNNQTVFESTNDSSIMNPQWLTAIDQIFRVMEEQVQATFDANYNVISYYNWTGGNRALAPAVDNEGNGEPKAYTGMVGTHHRPSDDHSIYAFLTPANAMLSVEMTNLANILDAAGKAKNVSQSARKWSAQIKNAIEKHALVNGIYAYETNGLGSAYVMDDANVPSLLSMPYLGYLDKNDRTYQATRKLLLSRMNPYYVAGKNFSGIGGPHVDVSHPWPMSQVSAIFTTDNDAEIMERLYMIANNTAGLGLIHESVDINSYTGYTRPWFAWANSYFAEMILDLASRKPGLIFKTNTPYTPGSDHDDAVKSKTAPALEPRAVDIQTVGAVT